MTTSRWRSEAAAYFRCGTLFSHGTFLAELRAWAIAGLAGAALGVVVARCAAGNDVIAVIDVNNDGYAQPMSGLVAALEDDAQKTEVQFDPPGLEDLFVCEYDYLRGPTGRDILLEYLSRVSLCVSTSRVGEDEFIVRANPQTNELRQSAAGEYFCKCPPIQ